MKVFLDTNIILDFYDSDRGHFRPAAIVFDLAYKGEIELSVCGLSFVNAFFILRGKYDKTLLYEKMRFLCKLCNVTPVDTQVVEKALALERYDFEDAVQYFSSTTIEADVILTRDKKGFREFDVPHMSPSDFLSQYFSQKHRNNQRKE